MSSRVLAVFVLVALLAPACSRGDETSEAVSLDGRARRPDVVGVVEMVDFERITIGGRKFGVSPRLQCFATASRLTVPLLGRMGQFVHAGVAKGEVVWIASFGPVTQIGDRQPAVLYVGTVKSKPKSTEVHFDDGTLLRLGDGVTAPDTGVKVRADIDGATGKIITLTAA